VLVVFGNTIVVKASSISLESILTISFPRITVIELALDSMLNVVSLIIALMAFIENVSLFAIYGERVALALILLESRINDRLSITRVKDN